MTLFGFKVKVKSIKNFKYQISVLLDTRIRVTVHVDLARHHGKVNNFILYFLLTEIHLLFIISSIVFLFSGTVSSIPLIRFLASSETLDHSFSGNANSPALMRRFIPGEIGCPWVL